MLLGLDVRISGAWLTDISKDQALGERGESSVRMEQTSALQFPGITAEAAATLRQGYYEKGDCPNIPHSNSSYFKTNHFCTY